LGCVAAALSTILEHVEKIHEFSLHV